MPKDGSNHDFIEIENCIRLTFIPSKDRDAEKDWAGMDTIRIQIKKGDSTSSLHMGPEIPIKSSATILSMISAICELYNRKS